jgi:hypothetical protein
MNTGFNPLSVLSQKLNTKPVILRQRLAHARQTTAKDLQFRTLDPAMNFGSTAQPSQQHGFPPAKDAQ